MRQGKYTKKLTFWQWSKRTIKQKWQWWKGLSWKKKALIIGVPLFLIIIVFPLLTYAYFARDIADKERLMNRNNTGVVLQDRHGETFYSFGRAEHRDMIPLDQISQETKDALIASEDKNFYDHSGFSIGSMLVGLYASIVNPDATYGGSTLTQQLAKNTVLTSDQTFLRKYQEISIAIAIERHYSKDEILEMYLNSVYYGEGAFGIEDAAGTYYGKAPRDLDLAEGSMLVGILPAPAAYSPISGDPELAKERQETTLQRMVENDMITEQEATAAAQQELAFSESAGEEDNKAPHFAEMVMNELYEEYGEERVNRSGYQVQTGLDLAWQGAAQQAINDNMPTVQQGGGSNASAVTIDPRDGQIRALVGSADWNNEDFGKVNMTTTPRQPGSSIKPLIYAEAMQRRAITPATILRDEPTDFGGYTPENFDFAYRGDITARNALGQSLNIPAVKVMEEVGVNPSARALERMGITSLDDPSGYGLSLVLGAAEIPLIEMTNAYAGFANEGENYQPPVSIVEIRDKYDDTIFEAEEAPTEIVTPETAFLISSMLSDEAARAPTFGSSLNIPGYPVAVKTGTTDDYRDALTIGYTPSVATGVWVGNNDNEEMTFGGSSMAGPIWRQIMATELEGTEPEPFQQPSGVEEAQVCAGGQSFTEYFLVGTAPSDSCAAPAPEPEQPEARPREEERPERPQRQPEPEPEPEPEEPEEDDDDDDDETLPTPSPNPPPVNSQNTP